MSCIPFLFSSIMCFMSSILCVCLLQHVRFHFSNITSFVSSTPLLYFIHVFYLRIFLFHFNITWFIFDIFQFTITYFISSIYLFFLKIPTPRFSLLQYFFIVSSYQRGTFLICSTLLVISDWFLTQRMRAWRAIGGRRQERHVVECKDGGREGEVVYRHSR